jgi:hypothetical protein
MSYTNKMTLFQKNIGQEDKTDPVLGVGTSGKDRI